jgi:hypothetical protein
MQTRNRSLLDPLAVGLVAALLFATAPAAAHEPAFTSDFRLEECEWDDEGENPLFPLEVGVFQRLEGESDGEEVVVLRRVTAKTKDVWLPIGGVQRRVRTRVLKETEWTDGELSEISFNYFAACEPRNDVVYFGEKVFNYEDGEVVNNDGSWVAGTDGAMPGIIMPGTFLLGSRYQQEVAPGVAEDRAEHTDMGLDVEVEAGSFSGCVEVMDTDPLGPPGPGDRKVYCPGVGLTIDEDIELVDFEGLDDDDDD